MKKHFKVVAVVVLVGEDTIPADDAEDARKFLERRMEEQFQFKAPLLRVETTTTYSVAEVVD